MKEKLIVAYDNYNQPIYMNDEVNLKNGDIAKVVGVRKNGNLKALNKYNFEYNLDPYSVIK
jgi:hypothetical protein